MSLVKRKRNRNGNGNLFPSTTNDFLSDRFFTPRLFDLDDYEDSFSMPPANIEETDKEFVIELSAPGLKRDDFKVDIDNGDLVISCEKKTEEKEERKNYHRQEFSYSSFCRRFPLPENTTEDKISAKYDNGMLHVKIPKKETTVSQPKKSIKVD
jgi:HSP20 family protein